MDKKLYNLENLGDCAMGVTKDHYNELLSAYEALKAELERERIRLAACGTAALGYHKEVTEEYKSASLDDVLQMVAENSQLREHLLIARNALFKIHSETAAFYLTPKHLLQSKYNIAHEALSKLGEDV